MQDFEMRSTSRNTAQCTSIVLRETEHVRLVFKPTLVNNTKNPEARVRGDFAYEKKAKKDEWAPVTTERLSTLKKGEGYKLELHSEELLTFHREVAALYQVYAEHGIRPGKTKFVRLKASLARFFQLGQTELSDLLESDSEGATSALLKLVNWLASSPQAGEIVSRLSEISPSHLPGLNTLIGLASVKAAMSYWKEHDAESREEFWQQALAERSYVLSQVFAYPVVVIKSKAYVGGKQIDNTEGKIVDFVGTVESTKAVVLMEIKTPQTQLLGQPYRGVYPLSPELTGAIAQALVYRQVFARDFDSTTARLDHRLTLGDCPCLIVAGIAG